MNTTHDTPPPLTRHQAAVETGEEVFAVAGGGLRIVELGIVTVLALLVFPPFAILAVVVAVPVIAISAAVAALVAIVWGPIWLVRHVRAHHREHGSTLFLHRLTP